MSLLLFGSRPRQHKPPPERSTWLIRPRRLRSERGRDLPLFPVVGTAMVEPARATRVPPWSSTSKPRWSLEHEVSEDVQEDLHQEQHVDLEEIQEEEGVREELFKELEVKCTEELDSWRLMMQQEVERIHGMLNEVREEADDIKHGRQVAKVNSASEEVQTEQSSKDETSHRTQRKRTRKRKHGPKPTGEQGEDDEEDEDANGDEEDDEEEDYEEESNEETPPMSDVERQKTPNLIDKLFAMYASRSRGHKARLIQKAHLSAFASDLRAAAPSAYSWFKSNWVIIEFIFDDTEDLQHSMSHPDARPAPGLAIEWFRVFVQKAVSRLGPRFTGCFEVFLSSRV